MVRPHRIGCLIAVVLAIGLAGWIVHAIGTAREAARASGCCGQLGQLAFALHCYHDIHGCFPPAHVTDASGKPIHSWRVLVLPFIDGANVYAKYDLTEPWNGPNNRKLADSIYHNMWHCDSGPHMGNSPITDYVLVTGPGTVFPDGQTTSRTDITDGPENTLLLVEIADSDIHWMEPRDLHVDQLMAGSNVSGRPRFSSPHTRGPAVVFADGISAWRVPGTLSPQSLQALATIAGNEPVTRDQLSRTTRNWGRVLSEQ
jgi:hypothetical protein